MYEIEEEKKLVISSRKGNKKSYSLLVKEGARLSVVVAEKYNKYSDMAELIREGIRGWFLAYKKYDVNKPYKLSTYSTWWIRAAIHEHITGISIQDQARSELAEEKVKKRLRELS